MTDILNVKVNGEWVGIPAIKGEDGQDGQDGEGVPTGGTTGQVLTKKTNTDFDTEWQTLDALPSQTGQSGKYLTTDGSSASWGSITIPQVNDATLTINQGGTLKGTFTANASSNVTVNLDGNQRNIGEIVQSTIPLTDAGLHLLDGSLIQGSGIYSAFVDYIADLYDNTTGTIVSNVNISGAITNTDGVLSGFVNGTTNASVNKSFSPSTNTWEIVVQNTTGADSANYQGIIGRQDGFLNLALLRTSDNKLAIFLGSVYNSFDIANGVTSTSTISANTSYYFKVKFDGSKYTVDVSTDKENWTNYITITSSTSIFSGAIMYLGIDTDISTNPYVNLGTIDLKECYINIDGSRWWTGAEEIKPIFCTEEQWQTSVTNYGSCDKYVYDSVNNTVRLPKHTTEHGALIKSYKSGADWYRIYSDGWCEQGGYIAYTTDYAMLTINFLKPFINTNYNFSRTWHSTYTTAAAAQCAMLGYNTKSTNSITIQSSVSPYGAGSDWQACGYIDISDYQYSPIYEYLVIATSTKTEIEVDIDEIATDLNGKADVDLTNINNTGKIAIAHNAMPSDTYETLTVLSSGSEYTAPADGWFSAIPNGGNLGTGQWISLYYPNALFGSGLNYAGGGNVSSYINLEAKKGQKVVFLYGNITSANLNLVFYYAQGSESEAS